MRHTPMPENYDFLRQERQDKHGKGKGKWQQTLLFLLYFMSMIS